MDTYASNFEWLWTANFEAFDAFPRTVVDGGQTPAGTYRFVIDGTTRHGGADAPYYLESGAFNVRPWAGITATDFAVNGDGDVTFKVNNAYPRSYTSVFPYVKDDNDQRLCKTCAFRPWAAHGKVVSATVHIDRDAGGVDDIIATESNGVWTATTNLQPGDSARIDAGSIVDDFGEFNGTAYTIA